jgi:competence protein ComFC
LKCLQECQNFESQCYICKNPSKDFEIHSDCQEGLFYKKVILLTHYKNPVIKKLITDAKFYKKKDIFEDFGKYLTKLLIKYEKDVNNKNTLIVPIPIHFLRKWKRGYNQSELLCKEIVNRTGLEYIPNLLIKNKSTRQQSKVWKKDRQENLENSFEFNKKHRDNIDKIKNKKIILVDDVISTWSTLNEVSKILYENWFTDITCLVIASD